MNSTVVSWSAHDCAVLLASALGQDKSDEVVISTARRLGITRSAFTAEDVRAIFDDLALAEGLVGVVARFAVFHGDVDKLIAQAPSAPATPSLVAPSVDLLPLLSPALGAEMARAAIEQAAARRGLEVSTSLSSDAAVAVLDEMSKVEGIVGVVARFAKARFLLDPEK
jgi:hypothetical protein